MGPDGETYHMGNMGQKFFGPGKRFERNGVCAARYNHFEIEFATPTTTKTGFQQTRGTVWLYNPGRAQVPVDRPTPRPIVTMPTCGTGNKRRADKVFWRSSISTAHQLHSAGPGHTVRSRHVRRASSAQLF